MSKGNRRKPERKVKDEHDGQTVTVYFLANHDRNGQMPDNRRSSGNEQGNPEAFRRTHGSGEKPGRLEQNHTGAGNRPTQGEGEK